MDDVLVVVDGTSPALVESGQLWTLQVANVKDVGCRQAVGSRALRAVTLIKLIVEHDEFLVHLVEDDTLVDVFRAQVGCAGDEGSGIAGFIGCVVDGDSVLVVSVADITALVPRIWTSVDQALSIVNVSVPSRTSCNLYVTRESPHERILCIETYLG